MCGFGRENRREATKGKPRMEKSGQEISRDEWFNEHDGCKKKGVKITTNK